MAYDKPNYTQTPNAFFDKHLPEIKSMAELKVTLLVLRNTIGWHKDVVQMSLSELETLTGMARHSVLSGIAAALKRETIRRVPSGQGYVYEANVRSGKVVQDLHQSASANSAPELVQDLDRSADVSLYGLKKELNTHDPSVSSPVGSGEIPDATALAAVTKTPEFSVPASARLAARPGPKKRPRPVAVELIAIPDGVIDKIAPADKRWLMSGLDMERGEFPLRVEAWQISREKAGTKFTSSSAMLKDLRAYLINCKSRRAS